MKGSRIHGIVRELRNENIDVIHYTTNENLLIARARAPAKISSISIDKDNAKADVFLKPKDICDGNKKLNVAMVAQLFNTNHGLKMDEVEKKRRSSIIMDLDKLVLVDDAGDSREERVFRMWINSCNIDGSGK
jgi:N utilization substance protein A